MKFIVKKEIFDKLPTACFGIVVARDIDNSKVYPEVDQLLDKYINEAESYFKGKKVKETEEILPYRKAFIALNINPNKYLCSVEALMTRISKGKELPHINPIVDLVNAISLKYKLPMGAHDLSNQNEDIYIRVAQSDDTFLPFGSEIEENPEVGEVVYAVGHQVRTRRWTWRQSEYGKISSSARDIFFPIDGFIDSNHEKVLIARDELQMLLEQIFGCKTIVGFVDKENPEIDF